MDKKKIPQQVIQLAVYYFNSDDFAVAPLVQSGSARSYFRVSHGNESAVAAYSENIPENEAFLSFRKAFYDSGLRVPALYAVADDKRAWLLEDAGDTSLFDMIPEEGVQKHNVSLMNYYRQVLADLYAFQLKGSEVVDFSKCVPRADFDERAIRWDLNYFKYYFLKPHLEDFDEDTLEDGFDFLVSKALKAERNYFMYRDFQSRNILLKGDKLCYIDFQGGRRGPLAYDLVSLVYQSRAKIAADAREELLEHYMDIVGRQQGLNRERFREEVSLFAFIRMLQVLGAYGFRGKIQQKPLFLSSISGALNNLEDLFPAMRQHHEMHHFIGIIKKLVESYRQPSPRKSASLTVRIFSFSYLKEGMPQDESGNGGGHVFDCRALPNPGRYEAYKHLTGLDREVVDFLNERSEVSGFILKVLDIITQSVENYIDRGFEHLMVGFGCTGGQHRSVYCAEQVARMLRQKYDMKVVVRHYQKETGY